VAAEEKHQRVVKQRQAEKATELEKLEKSISNLKLLMTEEKKNQTPDCDQVSLLQEYVNKKEILEKKWAKENNPDKLQKSFELEGAVCLVNNFPKVSQSAEEKCRESFKKYNALKDQLNSLIKSREVLNNYINDVY
jgi:hypothetical protein